MTLITTKSYLKRLVAIKTALSYENVMSAKEVAEKVVIPLVTTRRLLVDLEVLELADRVSFPRENWSSNRNHCIFGYKLHKMDIHEMDIHENNINAQEA